MDKPKRQYTYRVRKPSKEAIKKNINLIQGDWIKEQEDKIFVTTDNVYIGMKVVKADYILNKMNLYIMALLQSSSSQIYFLSLYDGMMVILVHTP